MSIKAIPGVSKKADSYGRSRVFDLDILRKHFEIEPKTAIPILEIDDPCNLPTDI